MSSVDTDHVSLQDNLSPEILRRLQVEELWARRHVLADLMNAERMEVYVSRRSLHWPTRFAAMDMVWKDPQARAPTNIVPIKSRNTFAPSVQKQGA